MNTDISWLEDRMKSRALPLVIDGGMGTELEKSGVPMDGRVWSSRAVLSHPESVRRTHEAFINAGAEVIITNTFAAARHMLEPGGLGEHVRDINLDAVRLAQQARDNTATGSLAIAGSICEWAPTDDVKWHSPESVRESTREQAGILAQAGVDFFALEMCEEIDLAAAAIEATLEFGLPIWIGMSARRFRDSSSLSVFDDEALDFESLVKRLADYPAMMMNVMHTPLPDVAEAVAIVQKHWAGPIGVYPESGYFKMPNWQFVDVVEPEELVRQARDWIDSGVRMVGGCCGLGPEHIRALRQAFTDKRATASKPPK
jgi:S-methylmethionine-dependent homocysteine/selenocysteine methylase